MNTRFGFVSTFPPTQCGLATFTAALRGALFDGSTDVGCVVRLVEAPTARAVDEAVSHLVMGDVPSLHESAARLNQCDVAIVQHEYGVYGGEDGSDVLLLLDRIQVPTVVVLHTVLSRPTTRQRQILESVVSKADAVVTMTEAARGRLASGYAVDMAKVCIIAHGAPSPRPTPILPTVRAGHVTILTWGLLGPGKGIEWAVQAMGMVGDLRPMPRYVIAGQTHPKVVSREGEAYRDRLHEQVRQVGVEAWVRIDGRYRDADALATLVRSADIVLLPYDSTEQVTSGVLIEAIAAGKPVVATAFPHALELLAGGAGIVVPHRDPAAIAAALRSMITQKGLAATMANAAAASAPKLLWPAIAEQYRALAARLITASIAA